MIDNGWLQIAIFGAFVVAITKPFGFYMTRVFVGEWTPLSRLLRPVARIWHTGARTVLRSPRRRSDTGQSIPQCQQPLAAERRGVQFLLGRDGNLAVSD
jgi:hypothetical protein